MKSEVGLWDRNLLLPDFSKGVQDSSRTGDFSAAKQWYSEPTSINRARHTAQHFFLYELVRFLCGDKLDLSLFPA